MPPVMYRKVPVYVSLDVTVAYAELALLDQMGHGSRNGSSASHLPGPSAAPRGSFPSGASQATSTKNCATAQLLSYRRALHGAFRESVDLPLP